MARSRHSKAPAAEFQEFGATGLRQYSGYVREEWLRSLIGRKGMLTLREMRDNDPIIAAVFTAVEMLLRPVKFRIDPADEKNPDDKKAADFIQSNFADMEHSWPDFMADALSFLQFGFGVYEIVYKYRRGESDDPTQNSSYDDGLIGWRKFAGRAQETLLHWVFDQAGDAVAMVQLLPTGGPLLNVPLSKCLHFRTTPYKANPEGRSIMRSMYDYYYLKKRIQQIEAIGVSRDLAGLLTVYVPARWMQKDATPGDLAQLATVKEMVNQVNNNEQAGLVLPTIMDEKGTKQLLEVKLLATGGRRQFATTDIISRYDHGMVASMLADFITLGSAGGSHGSYAQSRNKTDMFSLAVVGYLDIIATQLERRACPDLLQLNKMKGKVIVTHGDIARRDLAEIGTYIMDLAQAGALVPDDTLEAYLREEAGMPAADNPTGVSDSQQDEADQKAKELEAKSPLGNALGGNGGPSKPGGNNPSNQGNTGGTVGKRRRRPGRNDPGSM